MTLPPAPERDARVPRLLRAEGDRATRGVRTVGGELDRSRLVVRAADDARIRLAARGAVLVRAELRLVDHPAHDPRARRDGAADREADALDGAHAPAPAEDQGDPGEARGRSPEAVRGDDEPLPAGEGESARRLPADVSPAARLRRVCSTRCAARSSSARRRSSAGSTISPRPICCSRCRASISRSACCRC